MNFAAICAAAATTLLATAAAATPMPCLVEANAPELLPEAKTIGMLTCDALRERGVDISDPSTGQAIGPAFKISLHRLGDEYMMRVAKVGVPGQPDMTRQMRVERLRDAEKAAPRIAEALTGGRDLKKSQEMETVTAGESGHMQKKAGDFLWGIGVYGSGVLAAGVPGGFGFHMSAQYETPTFGALATMRGGGSDDMNMADISVGARYFFSQRNTSLFLGGGLGGTVIGIDTENEYGTGEGLSAYGEIGVEFMRLYSSRLSIDVRVTAPFFELETENWNYDYSSGCVDYCGYEDSESIYVIPVTLGATFSW